MNVLDLEVSTTPIRSVKYNTFRSDRVLMVLSVCNELVVFTFDVSGRPRRIHVHSTHPDTLVEAFFVTQSEVVIVTDKSQISLVNYFEGRVLNACSLSIGIICCAILNEQYILLGIKTGGVVAVDWTQLPTHKWLSATPLRPLLSMMCTEVILASHDREESRYLCLVVFLNASFTISMQLYTLDFDECPETRLHMTPIATSSTSCILHLLWMDQDLVLTTLRVYKSGRYFHCSIDPVDLRSYLEKIIISARVKPSKQCSSLYLRGAHPTVKTFMHQLRTETLDKWITNCPIVASSEGSLIILSDTCFHALLSPTRKPFTATYHGAPVTSVCYHNQSFVSGDEAGHVYCYNKSTARVKNG
ncbi:Hypothetical protein GLP15_107 [Giardia lamblia P15]|uniref:Uncharacterized protein n=1 Tax=Giardia intestinalis (strain P15) TaxID=658858 RepID=E1EX15_GIAIA|nr:Hypothetical protein GLP15_107 [Giardia lamblia P15]